MLNNADYKIGTIVSLKKTHPSGTIEWEVVRTGADIKIMSTLVKGLFIMFSRSDFNKKVNTIIKF